MKLWKLTEDYNLYFQQFEEYDSYDMNNLTSADVAKLFVYITKNWYGNPYNTMFGQKDYVEKVIFKYVESDIVPVSADFNADYAVYKYKTDFFGEAFIPK